MCHLHDDDDDNGRDHQTCKHKSGWRLVGRVAARKSFALPSFANRYSCTHDAPQREATPLADRADRIWSINICLGLVVWVWVGFGQCLSCTKISQQTEHRAHPLANHLHTSDNTSCAVFSIPPSISAHPAPHRIDAVWICIFGPNQTCAQSIEYMKYAYKTVQQRSLPDAGDRK